MNLSNLFPWDMLREDRALRALATVLVTLLFVVLTVSSCAIWPAVFSLRASGNASTASVARAVLAAGIPLAVVNALVAVVLGWFDRRYSFAKSLLTTYTIGLVVMVAVLFAVPADLSGLVEMTGAVRALVVIVQVLLGTVLAFLPALLATILGWLVREVYYVVSEIHR